MSGMDNAMGYDVMAELEKLVADASFGGSKRDNRPGLGRKRVAMLALAKDVREIYNAFDEVGFDREQAFSLTLETVRAINRSLLG